MDVERGTYKHFKGGEYTVLAVAHHSETLEEMVVYQANYTSEEYGENAIWVRPKSLFCATVTHDGKEVPRFKKI